MPDINENGLRMFKSNQVVDKRIVNICKIKCFADDYKIDKNGSLSFNSIKEIEED